MQRDAQRIWMARWRRAAEALAEQRRRELAALTDLEALAAAEALLALGVLVGPPDGRAATSGLVQQQAVFHRRPPA